MARLTRPDTVRGRWVGAGGGLQTRGAGPLAGGVQPARGGRGEAGPCPPRWLPAPAGGAPGATREEKAVSA